MDTNNDRIYDEYYSPYPYCSYENVNKNIWIGQLRPPQNRVELLEDYFKRAIDYMNEKVPNEDNAIFLTSDSNLGGYATINEYHLDEIHRSYSLVTFHEGIDCATFQNIWTSGYNFEWLFINDHGGPTDFLVFPGYSWVGENPCPAQFCWLDPCFSGWYFEENCMAAWITLALGSQCLGTFASTTTGPLMTFYSYDEPHCFYEYINQDVSYIEGYQIQGFSMYHVIDYYIKPTVETCSPYPITPDPFITYFGDPLLKTWRA